MARGAKDRERLTRVLEERVEELGIKWRDVAQRANYSESIIRRIRNDHSAPINPEIADAIDRALGWSDGWRRILNGVDPVESVRPAEPADDHVESDMAVLQYWSRYLPRDQFRIFADHMTRIRLAAYEAGRRDERDGR
jgi:hypothetical protein